jgi:hypothetical protein
MDDDQPSDAIRLRALELAFLGILPFLSRGSIEVAESNMAHQEAFAVGDERAAAKAAGLFFSTAIGWHLEADDDAGLIGPDTPEDPEEIARFDFEVDRLIQVEARDDQSAEGLERVADDIMAVPSTIGTMGNMHTRERLADALRARAAEARKLSLVQPLSG